MYNGNSGQFGFDSKARIPIHQQNCISGQFCRSTFINVDVEKNTPVGIKPSVPQTRTVMGSTNFGRKWKMEESENCGDSIKADHGKTSNNSKPSMTYIALIGNAILQSADKRLNLGSIYQWIESNYPYFVNKGQGWRNSVRHNLSLNDCFIKAGRCEDGKGNYWTIHPANYKDFLQGDFRQRRCSRKSGHKKVGFGHSGHPYQLAVGNFNPNNMSSSMFFNSWYSPYTESERQAYKLDNVLRNQCRQINHPSLVNWTNYNSASIERTTSQPPYSNYHQPFFHHTTQYHN